MLLARDGAAYEAKTIKVRKADGQRNVEASAPPSEFSIGMQARSAIHCDNAWKATSNCEHGRGW